MPTKQEHPEYTVKSVCYAVKLLEILAEQQTGLSLMRLSERIELSRNKTFRLLATLCETGLVERDEETSRYRLGACSIVLGQKFLMSSSVLSFAHPVIEQLARKHGEAVYMSVIRGDEVLFLDMADCDQRVKTLPLVGRRFPCLSNAAGKVLKALDSREMLERVLSRRGKRNTSPELGSLACELEHIRDSGVAVDDGGLGEGVSSVAVAVRDYAGKVVCAITMIGPSFRMLTDRLEREIIPSLKEGAGLVSGRLGYLPA